MNLSRARISSLSYTHTYLRGGVAREFIFKVPVLSSCRIYARADSGLGYLSARARVYERGYGCALINDAFFYDLLGGESVCV